MTLPELCECNENTEHTMPVPEEAPASSPVGKAVQSVLQQAASDGRATCSLTACVNLLSSRPDDVMLCVMPTLTHATTEATIQSTLIRAVCQEHSILVLAVDCDVKLAKAVCLEEEEGVDYNCNVLKTPAPCSDDAIIISSCDNMAPVMGFPCVLVEYPHDGASKEDETVAEFCKQQLYGESFMEPYIELPD